MLGFSFFFFFLGVVRGIDLFWWGMEKKGKGSKYCACE